MNELFADSGYWIAMMNSRDQWNRAALIATDQIRGRRIITSEMVIVELLNGVARLGEQGRRQAVDMAQGLYLNPNVAVIEQSAQQLNAAIERYANRLDQPWSVTDCASFLIMEEMGIAEALAYDVDFVQAGFRALLREF